MWARCLRVLLDRVLHAQRRLVASRPARRSTSFPAGQPRQADCPLAPRATCQVREWAGFHRCRSQAPNRPWVSGTNERVATPWSIAYGLLTLIDTHPQRRMEGDDMLLRPGRQGH